MPELEVSRPRLRAAAEQAALFVAIGLLLLFDVVIAALNVLSLDAVGESTLPRMWQINAEWTVPEIVQYTKWLALAGLAALAFRATRARVLGVWAVFFAYAALDDALSIHERIGRVLSELLAAMSGVELRPGLVELVWISAVAGLLLVSLRRALVGIADASARRYTTGALILVGVYALFSVVLDLAQAAYAALRPSDPRGEAMLGAIENGGELVALTVMVGFSVRHRLLLDRARDQRG